MLRVPLVGTANIFIGELPPAIGLVLFLKRSGNSVDCCFYRRFFIRFPFHVHVPDVCHMAPMV